MQNAVRAMPEGGRLAIRAVLHGNDTGEVIFTDNGVGMTPDDIEQIFQPFHSGFSKGLGLGLSVVFRIMEDHRGRISFESEKGKGTKVILYREHPYVCYIIIVCCNDFMEGEVSCSKRVCLRCLL